MNEQGQWNIEYHLVQNTIAKTTDLQQFTVDKKRCSDKQSTKYWRNRFCESIKKYRNTEETTIVYTFTKNESGSKYATWFKRQLK